MGLLLWVSSLHWYIVGGVLEDDQQCIRIPRDTTVIARAQIRLHKELLVYVQILSTTMYTRNPPSYSRLQVIMIISYYKMATIITRRHKTACDSRALTCLVLLREAFEEMSISRR